MGHKAPPPELSRFLEETPMSQSHMHANSFAGISGSVSAEYVVANTDTRILLDPTGRWAIRLTSLERTAARMLLQILRDLAPPATQADNAFIRQVAAFDVAAREDRQLLAEIDRGLAALDTLARKLTRRSYLEIEERTLRRTLLSQIADQPLLDRLGVRTPAYSSAAI